MSPEDISENENMVFNVYCHFKQSFSYINIVYCDCHLLWEKSQDR